MKKREKKKEKKRKEKRLREMVPGGHRERGTGHDKSHSKTH